MSEQPNAEFERLNSLLSNPSLEPDGQEKKTDSAESLTALSRKGTTEMMMKTLRYMTPSDKLKQNKKLLSRVMSFREAMLRNLMNKQRSDNEAWSLYEYVRDFKFFQQYVNIETMENEAVLHICKNIKYEKFKKDDVIFRQGDPSNGKVYILFSGSIKVIVKELDIYEKENLNMDHSFMKPVNSSDTSIIDIPEFTPPSAKQSRRGSLNIELLGNIPQSPKLIAKPRKSVDLSKSNYLKMYIGGDNDLKIEDEHKKSKFGGSKKSPSPSPSESSRASSRVEILANSEVASRRVSISVKPFDTEPDSNPSVKELKQTLKRPSSEKNRKNNRTNMHRLALLKSTLEKGLDKSLHLPEEKVKKKDKREHELGYVRSIITDRGAFFGEKALVDDGVRSASIVADSNLELLVLTKEVFKYIKKVFDSEKRELREFLTRYIPHLDVISSPQIMDGFMFSFKDVFIEIGNHLITEGDFGDTVYLLYQGTAEVYRNVIIHEPDTREVSIKKVKEFYVSKRKTKETLVLAGISAGSFIGEELMLKEAKRYHYSIKVTSDKARFLATTKLKINGRFPEESQKKLREMAQAKKAQRETLLLEMLSKRGLTPMTESLENFPLNVKREKKIEIFSGVDTKINSKPMFSASYKILTPRIESTTPSNSQARQTPKNFTIEEDKTRTHLLNFSRKNYMPIKQVDEKNDNELSKDSDDKLNGIFQNINIKRAISPPTVDPKKSNPIRSEESNHEFKNINQYYDQVLGKFGINDLLKETKSHIDDVNYFKLDFGVQYTPKKQRFLPSIDQPKPREKTTRNGRRNEEKMLEPEYKITSTTANTDRRDMKPILIDLMKSLDDDNDNDDKSDSIIERPKENDKENKKIVINPRLPSQESEYYFKIKPGGQILMPLFSDRSLKAEHRKTMTGFSRDSVKTFNKTTGQFSKIQSPRMRVPTVNPSNIPVTTQRLINKLKKSMHKPSELKLEKKPEIIRDINRVKSPKQVSMEVCFYSGLHNTPPRKYFYK